MVSIEGQIEVTFPVSIEGLAPEFRPIETPVLTVKFSGPVNLLKEIWTVGVVAKIQLTDLGVGVHTVPLFFDVPEGIKVLTEPPTSLDVELIATE